MTRKTFGATAAVLTLALAGFAPCAAFGQSNSDDWKWRGTIYGWFPDVSGSSNLPAGSSTTVNVDIDQILKSLDMIFMGSLDARKGRWGGFTDLIYLDLSNNKSGSRSLTFTGPGGNIAIPAGVSMDANMKLKGLVWTLAGTYTPIQKPDYEMSLLAGVRYLAIDSSLGWQATGAVGALPPVVRSGGASGKSKIWDAIIGVRGIANIEQSKWFVPYYMDVGAGDSQSTWQAAGGIGYRFGWGDVTAIYRYLEYNVDSGGPLKDVNFSGPQIGATWRW